jgi:hypothetical protein
MRSMVLRWLALVRSWRERGGVPRPGIASAEPGLDNGAVAALALGIASIPFFLVIFIPMLAIGLGVSSRRKIKADPRMTGYRMATAGVVFGTVGLGDR